MNRPSTAFSKVDSSELGEEKASEMHRNGQFVLFFSPMFVFLVYLSITYFKDYIMMKVFLVKYNHTIELIPRFYANLVELNKSFGSSPILDFDIYYFSLVFSSVLLGIIVIVVSIYKAYFSKTKATIDLIVIKSNRDLKGKAIFFGLLIFYLFTTETKISFIGMMYKNGIILAFDTILVSFLLASIYVYNFRYWTISRFKGGNRNGGSQHD